MKYSLAIYFKFIILVSFLFSYCYSQTIVSKDSLALKIFRYAEKQETVVVVDSNDLSMTFALTDNKYIYIIKYDSVYNSLGNIEIKKPSNKYETLLGSSQNDKFVSFYFTEDKLNSLSVIHIDKKTLTASFKEFDFNFSKQGFINALSYQDKFYLLTVKEASSFIFLYVFENEVEPIKQEFQFSNKFFNDEESNTPLATKLGLFGYYSNKIPVHYLEENVPLSIEMAASKAKIYCYNKTLTLSFDFIINKTSFLEINLNDLSYTTKIIDNNLFEEDDNTGIKSSNFLLEGTLYQIASKKDALRVRIVNMQTSEILKELNATANQTISFRNSALVRDGGLSLLTTDKVVSMENQEAFFTKMFRSDVGIVATHNFDTLELTIGGYSEKPNYYVSSTTPNVLGTGFSISPTTFSFHLTTLTRAMYFKSKLNANNFDHITGDMGMSKVQQVQDFLKKYNVYNTNEVIYLYNNKYHVAYYVPDNKKFIIVVL